MLNTELVKPTKSVLYTVTLEPITVLSLSDSAWKFFVEHGSYNFAVMDVPNRIPHTGIDDPIDYKIRNVHVWAERFVYRDAKTLMLFTNDDENALLMKASFLAGQQRQINNEKADAFARGFVKALSTL